MLDLGFLSNYWLDEFAVVFIASVVSILVVERYLEGRRRTKIAIGSQSIGNRIGFTLTSKGGTLHHPEVIYRRTPNSFEARKCELYDDDGNIHAKDFVLGGESVNILPFVAERRWTKTGDLNALEVKVSEAHTKNSRTLLHFEGVALSKEKTALSLESSDYGSWFTSLSVFAEGWSKEETYVFRVKLGVEVFVLNEEELAKPEDWHIWYFPSIKRERRKGVFMEDLTALDWP